jgi:hypothetical protein
MNSVFEGVISNVTQAFLVSRNWSQSCGAFSQLRLESQNDKKCDTFEELALVTNNGNIEFVESRGIGTGGRARA